MRESNITVEAEDALVDDCAFVMAPTPDTGQFVPLENDSVRDAVLHFMAEVLEGYDEFLVAPNNNWRHDTSVWFDIEGFLAQVCRMTHS